MVTRGGAGSRQLRNEANMFSIRPTIPMNAVTAMQARARYRAGMRSSTVAQAGPKEGTEKLMEKTQIWVMKHKLDQYKIPIVIGAILIFVLFLRGSD